MGVVQPVKFPDALGRGVVEFAEIIGLAVRVIALAYEIVPLLKRLHDFQDTSSANRTSSARIVICRPPPNVAPGRVDAGLKDQHFRRFDTIMSAG